MVRIKYEVKAYPPWGSFYATISGDPGEYVMFNTEIFLHFYDKIKSTFVVTNAELYGDECYSCTCSRDKKRISCEHIPFNPFFWQRIKYMITVINCSSWSRVRKPLCAGCGDMWKHWDERCVSCNTIQCDDNSQPAGVVESFNQLIDEIFSGG